LDLRFCFVPGGLIWIFGGFSIPSGLGKILGFTFPSPYLIPSTTPSASYLSTSTPNLQPNSSLLISASMIENDISKPTSVIYSITPSVAVGTIIADKPPSFIWNTLIDGYYNQIRLTLLGADLQPIQVQDGAMTIILVVASKEEVGVN
jgi:hypothetical protein